MTYTSPQMLDPVWKRNLQIALFCLIHIFIILVVFKSGLYRDAAEFDLSVPYLYASKIALGQVPYRDFAVEYPPLALIFMILPRLFSSQAAPYTWGFTIEMILVDLLGIVIIAALSQRVGLSLWKTLAVYTLALLAIGPLIVNRYDLIPAVIALLALYAFIRGNAKIAWALLAVGMLTKVFPVVMAPVFLLYDFTHYSYRRILSGVATFAITSVIIAIPFLWLSPAGFLSSFTYHAERGLQIESTYASFLLLGQKMGQTSLSIEHSFGSYNVVSPMANALASISPIITLLALALVFRSYYRGQKRLAIGSTEVSSPTQPEMAYLIGYALLAVLIFIITNKVLSPQFIIWLYPLIPLVIGRWRRISWLLFIFMGLMTYMVFPMGYRSLLEQENTAVIGVLFLRNITLIALAFLIAQAGHKPQPSAAASAPI